MKKEYDLKNLKKRSNKLKVDRSATKTPTSLRIDGSVLAWFKTEALRLGIPYQTLVSSVLHRFASGELLDRADVQKLIDKSKSPK